MDQRLVAVFFLRLKVGVADNSTSSVPDKTVVS